jgi:hypothetical protein
MCVDRTAVRRPVQPRGPSRVRSDWPNPSLVGDAVGSLTGSISGAVAREGLAGRSVRSAMKTCSRLGSGSAVTDRCRLLAGRGATVPGESGPMGPVASISRSAGIRFSTRLFDYGPVGTWTQGRNLRSGPDVARPCIAFAPLVPLPPLASESATPKRARRFPRVPLPSRAWTSRARRPRSMASSRQANGPTRLAGRGSRTLKRTSRATSTPSSGSPSTATSSTLRPGPRPILGGSWTRSTARTSRSEATTPSRSSWTPRPRARRATPSP